MRYRYIWPLVSQPRVSSYIADIAAKFAPAESSSAARSASPSSPEPEAVQRMSQQRQQQNVPLIGRVLEHRWCVRFDRASHQRRQTCGPRPSTAIPELSRRKHAAPPWTVHGPAECGSAALWPGAGGWRRRCRGCLGEPGVQLCPDLVRGVGAAAALCACDHHSGGRDACEPRQAEYLPPAHLPRLRLCLARASAWTRRSA